MQYFRGATAAEVIAVRLDHNDEIIPKLTQVAQETQIAAGAVLSGQGLLDHFTLEVAANVNWPPTPFSISKEGPANIISAQGHIVNGQVEMTMCATRRNETVSGKVMPTTRVLHAAEFLLLRVGNARWSRMPHPQTGCPLLQAVTATPQGQQLSLMGRPLDVAAIAMVPPALIKQHGVLPVAKTADTLVVAMVDPNNPFAVDDLRAATGLRIQTVAVPAQDLMPVIQQVLAGR